MAEYSLTAEALLSFGRDPPRGGRAFARWAAFADKVGQAILPFVVKPGRHGDVPFRALGMTPVKLRDMVPQPKEMWVLFCFKDSFREAVSPDSPLRTDGFPLVLEWRKGQRDSDLLSGAFHDLAGRIREQFGEEGKGWGLHPSFDRYGDTIAFTDADLFSDAENSLQIASAWGALAAGLHCCIRKKFPGTWPFPSVQWDWERKRAAGVAGIAEKLSVAADCRAAVVTVAGEQKKKTQELLAGLKKSGDGGRYGRLSVLSAGNADDPRVLARKICEGAADRMRFRRLMCSAAVFLVCSMVAAGLFFYDMTRTVSLYFADYVDCYGLPEGIYEVPKSSLRMRMSTYRFDYRGYYWGGVHSTSLPKGWFGVGRKLRRVVHVGPADVPTRQSSTFFPLLDRPDVADFSYDENGRLQMKTIRRRGGDDFVSGPVVKKMHYSNHERPDGKCTVNGFLRETFDDESAPYVLRGNATQLNNLSGFKYEPTAITCAYIDRDAQGRLETIRFFASSGGEVYPATDKDGVHGIEYVLTGGDDPPPAGRVKEQHYIDENGDLHADRYGVAKIVFGWSGADLESAGYFSAAGNAVIGRCGFHRGVVSCDMHGNPTNVVLYGNSGRRIYRTLRCDDLGDEAMGTAVWSSCSYVFSNGLAVARYSFQPNGDLLRRKGQASVIRFEYDGETGDCTAIRYFDADGSPVVSQEGYACAEFAVDRNTGERLSSRIFKEDGVSPAYNVQNFVSRFDREYDRISGETTECRMLDGNGNLMIGKDGFAICRMAYDQRGRLVRESMFDTATNLLVNPLLGGNVRCRTIEYPRKSGDWRKVRCWTDESCRTRAVSGDLDSGFMTKYDEFGRIEEEWRIDANDGFMRCPEGFAGYRVEYRMLDGRVEIVPGHFAEKGWHELLKTNYSAPGSPYYVNGGCRTREIYDSCHRLSFAICENENGERVETADEGVSVLVLEYNETGCRSGEWYFDRKGRPVLNKVTDVAGIRYLYDGETMMLVSRTGIDADLRSARRFKDERFSEIRHDFRPDGEEVTSFWHGGKRTRCRGGYHLCHIRREVGGGEEEVFFLDEQGEATEGIDVQGYKYHHGYAEYDAYHRRIRSWRVGVDGKLLEFPHEPFVAKEWFFDSQHRETEGRYVGDAKNGASRPSPYEKCPGSDLNGVSRYTLAYRGTTRLVCERNEYGTDEGPCLYGNPGVWRRKTLYDGQGRLTNECFYGIGDAPAVDCDGIRQWVHEYNRKGERTALTGYDPEGKPFNAVQRLLCVRTVLPEAHSAVRDIRPGDFLCGIAFGGHAADFSSGDLTDKTPFEWNKTIGVSKEYDKVVVVARKSGKGFTVKKVPFPAGSMGFVYGARPVSGKDSALLHDALAAEFGFGEPRDPYFLRRFPLTDKPVL